MFGKFIKKYSCSGLASPQLKKIIPSEILIKGSKVLMTIVYRPVEAQLAAVRGAVCGPVPAVVRPGVSGVQQRGVQHHHQGNHSKKGLLQSQALALGLFGFGGPYSAGFRQLGKSRGG